MKLPSSNRLKALIIVDVQPAFIKNHNQYLINEITGLVNRADYDLYVDSVFYAEKGSIWDKQKDWTLPKNDDTKTVAEIDRALESKKRLKIIKQTRSAFKGEPDLANTLRGRGIEEIHLVGVETNDCVLATAFDGFDHGFISYVIEECCDTATKGRHERAAKLLREQGMTNHSEGVKVSEV